MFDYNGWVEQNLKENVSNFVENDADLSRFKDDDKNYIKDKFIKFIYDYLKLGLADRECVGSDLDNLEDVYDINCVSDRAARVNEIYYQLSDIQTIYDSCLQDGETEKANFIKENLATIQREYDDAINSSDYTWVLLNETIEYLRTSIKPDNTEA